MNEYDQQPEGYDSFPSSRLEDLSQASNSKARACAPDQHVIPTSVFCVQCGYNLTGVAIGAKCPECGRIVAPSFHSQMLPTSGKAITSMVLGICSIVACMWYGVPSLICGPLAIIFARQAKGQVREGSVSPSSASMATAGFVCGIIGLVLALIGIGFFVWIFVTEF